MMASGWDTKRKESVMGKTQPKKGTIEDEYYKAGGEGPDLDDGLIFIQQGDVTISQNDMNKLIKNLIKPCSKCVELKQKNSILKDIVIGLQKEQEDSK